MGRERERQILERVGVRMENGCGVKESKPLLW